MNNPYLFQGGGGNPYMFQPNQQFMPQQQSQQPQFLQSYAPTGFRYNNSLAANIALQHRMRQYQMYGPAQGYQSDWQGNLTYDPRKVIMALAGNYSQSSQPQQTQQQAPVEQQQEQKPNYTIQQDPVQIPGQGGIPGYMGVRY